MEWAAREALSWTDNTLSGVGGGGTPLVSHIGMYPPPPNVPILVWGRVWFSSNYGSVRYLSFQFQMSKKEGETCEFKMD